MCVGAAVGADTGESLRRQNVRQACRMHVWRAQSKTMHDADKCRQIHGRVYPCVGPWLPDALNMSESVAASRRCRPGGARSSSTRSGPGTGPLASPSGQAPTPLPPSWVFLRHLAPTPIIPTKNFTWFKTTALWRVHSFRGNCVDKIFYFFCRSSRMKRVFKFTISVTSRQILRTIPTSSVEVSIMYCGRFELGHELQ